MAVGLLPMAACSDDDAVDPYTLNYCYVYQPYSTYAQLEYKANGQFLVDVANPLSVMPVRLTKPAPKDMNITVGIDDSLVAESNEANGTDYAFLTGCSILNSPLKIKAGEYVSTKAAEIGSTIIDEEGNETVVTETIFVNDSITVSFGDMSGFMTGETDYILPIVITGADGATISNSSRIFLTFSSTYHSNKISVDYLTTVSNNTDEEGWETANTNLTLTNFFNCEWNADDEIQIKASIDNSKIAAYNQENGTGYIALNGTSVKTPTVTIAEGNNSGNLQLTLGDYTGVANDIEYLIPIDLELIKGEGASLEATTVYVEVTSTPKEVYVSDYATGLTLIQPSSNWTATEVGDDYTEDASFLFTGSNYTYCPETSFEIDLGEVTTVDAFSLRWYSYYYQAAEVTNIQLSKDGEKWEDWGAAASPGQYASTWYLTFSKPASFRYMRFYVGLERSYGVYFRQISFFNK